MFFAKSFHMTRFLNQNHSVLVRGFFALAGLCMGFLATGQPQLSWHLCKCFWTKNFKPTARLAGWYLRISWM